MSLRVGMVLADKAALPDIRVNKEAAALTEAGYQVGLLAPGSTNLDVGAPAPTAVELYRTRTPPLTVAALSPRAKPRLLRELAKSRATDVTAWAFASGWEGLRFWPRAESPSWDAACERFVQAFAPDVLHAHDLIILPTVLSVAARHGLPVVADLHENWPAMLEVVALNYDVAKRQIWKRWWSPQRWRHHEGQHLPRCAAVLVVVPEAAERLSDYGVDPERVVIVSNTEPPPINKTADPAIVARYRDRWTALYAGGVGHHRGVDVILQAVPQIAQRCPEFLLLVVGADDHWCEILNEQAEQLGVIRHVEIRGWVPPTQIPSYIAASRAGLVPHRASAHTNTTVPHKLFQYMAGGRPVVVSSCRPLARIVRESEAGLVFDADNPASAAEVLLQLIEDPERARRLAQNGQRAVAGPFAWKHDAARLVDTYHDLLGGG